MFELKDIIDYSFSPIGILDVGAANNRTTLKYAPLLGKYDLNIQLFDAEGLDDVFSTDIPRAEVIRTPAVVGDGGPAQLNKTALPQMTSIYEANSEIVRLFPTLIGARGQAHHDGPFRIEEKINCQTKRIDDILAIDQPHYIKLDIQGGELNALKHARETLSSIMVLETEVEFIDIYKDQPLFAEIDQFLRAQGFVFLKFIDIHGRNFGSANAGNGGMRALTQAMWADALYIKRDLYVAVDKLVTNRVLEACVFLHDIYRCYDLVYHLLKQIDAKSGFRYSASYAEIITKTKFDRLYMNTVEKPARRPQQKNNG